MTNSSGPLKTKQIRPRELEGEIEDFVRSELKDRIIEAATEEKERLLLDYENLIKFNPDFTIILTRPEEFIEVIENKVKDILKTLPREVEELNIRLKNLPEDTEKMIRDIGVEDEGKLISVTGVVKYISDTTPTARKITFKCMSCSREVVLRQDREKKIKWPSRCQCGAKNKFKIKSAEKINTQVIEIEEPPERLETEQPRSIPLVLKRDLILPDLNKGITAGSRVRVTGIVKFLPKKGKKGSRLKTFKKKIDPLWIEPIKRTFSEIEVDESDIKKIKELAKSDNLFEKIRKSIAPSIAGREKIKLAIGLQMFGGVYKEVKDGNDKRGDIHILLAGDPGTSKTSLLRYVSKLSPKSSKVTGGSGTTSTGLTAAAVQKERGEWGLEAGAMVLASGGVALVDELDKMAEAQRNSLHEAMASQVVTINKANIHTTLPAKASVLASANPKEGRFNRYDQMAPQIALNRALINRFDLIFAMLSDPDKEKDEKVGKRIVNVSREPQKERAPIPIDLFRKYITYAKQIKPELTEKAARSIWEYYVEVRSKAVESTEGEEVPPIPITPRQVETMIRLTEASARARLSEKATVKDFKVAKDLIEYFRLQMGVRQKYGKEEVIDMSSLTAGGSGKEISMKKRFEKILERLAEKEEYKRGIPEEIIFETAEENDIPKEKSEDFLDKMYQNGEVWEPSSKKWKLVK